MKKWLFGLLVLVMSMPVRAQTFAEWWEQNKTRLEYYAKQIAELQVYIGEAEKGYSIVENGINTIGQIKKGEFNLHNAFYSSLESVNPTIAKLGEVADIIALQAAIVERFSSSLSRYRQNAALQADEVAYIGQVYQTVLQDAEADVTVLIQILTAGQLKMTDDQRMARLHGLESAMRQRYAFTAGFTNQADLLCLQRAGATSDLGTVQGLYGIP